MICVRRDVWLSWHTHVCERSSRFSSLTFLVSQLLLLSLLQVGIPKAKGLVLATAFDAVDYKVSAALAPLHEPVGGRLGLAFECSPHPPLRPSCGQVCEHVVVIVVDSFDTGRHFSKRLSALLVWRKDTCSTA